LFSLEEIKVQWNSVPEIISTFVLFVIFINSRVTHTMPSSRERLFRFILIYSISSFILNIISVWTIASYQVANRLFSLIVNSAYFLFYPLITPLFIIYILFYINEHIPEEHYYRIKATFGAIIVTTVAYLIFVGVALKYNLLFYLDENNYYHRGTLNMVPILMSIFHIIIASIVATRERHYLDRFFFQAVSWVPLLSLGIVIIQIFYAETILTGVAFSIAIISFYLNFQTSKISIDSLTRLPNRDTFIANLETLNKKHKTATVLVLSLHNFKGINDTFGHRKGDLLLISVADQLKGICPKGEVYRYGGDEFAIISTKKNHQSLVDNIETRFGESWLINGISTHLNASLAILLLPFNSDTKSDSISILDHAIKMGERQKSFTIIDCDMAVLQTIRRKNQILEQLLNTPYQNLFNIHYQPIFSLENLKLVSAEALLRMESEELGSVSPDEFIPLAEESGLIGKIGLFVLEEVAKFLNSLNSQLFEIPTISINFSSKQFGLSTLTSDFIKIIDSYKIPHNKINLELTESSFIGNSIQKVQDVMIELSEAGIEFNLDDFGKGYSNLSYVVNLPFKAIKLDKSLLWESKREKPVRQFITSLIKMVRQMGFLVIVEGVENIEQLDFLRTTECNMVQGYFLSPPLSGEDFIKALKKD
jgi:diguanylate cyclase (GGDEF)-like protein